MGPITTLSSVLGLSLTSGINLYATVAVVGLVTKFNLIKGLPPEFAAFDNGFLIGAAIFFYLCEFAADKIPGFDTLWDSVHTLIRPAGAAFISMAMVGDASPAVETAAALIGAGVGLTSHTVKAGTRLAVNTSPEPASNIAVSLAEDVGVVGLALLVMAHPYIALAISIIILTLIIIFGPGLLRGAMLLIKSFVIRITSLFIRSDEAVLKEDLPDQMDLALDQEISQGETILSSVLCYARKIKGCGRNRKGALILTDGRLLFVYRKLFKTRVKEWNHADLEKAAMIKKFLVNLIRVKIKGRFMVFVFLKNKTATTAELLHLMSKSTGQAEADASLAGKDAEKLETMGTSEN